MQFTDTATGRREGSPQAFSCLGALAGADLCASVLVVGLHLSASPNTTVGYLPAIVGKIAVWRWEERFV